MYIKRCGVNLRQLRERHLVELQQPAVLRPQVDLLFTFSLMRFMGYDFGLRNGYINRKFYGLWDQISVLGSWDLRGFGRQSCSSSASRPDGHRVKNTYIAET